MTETSEARVATGKAKRYMSQLVKHFADKLEATLEGDTGRLAFPFGSCALEAGSSLLVMRAEAAGPGRRWAGSRRSWPATSSASPFGSRSRSPGPARRPASPRSGDSD